MNLTGRNWMPALLLALATGVTTLAQGVSGSYLPLHEGLKWVLRNPSHREPVVFEVTRRDGAGFHMVSTNPWGSSEWTLEPRDNAFVMTRFGMGGQTMPLKDEPVFLDFGRRPGSSWSNSLGTLENLTDTATVTTAGQTYRDCIVFRHRPKGGSLVYTFARGVGFVQFGEGKNAFVLDERESQLPGGTERASVGLGAPERRDAPDRAGGRRGEPDRPRFGQRGAKAGGPVPVGLTFNTFANEPRTPDVMMKRYQQSLDTGVSLLVGGASFAELEPERGRYNLGDVNFLAGEARSRRMPIVYTFKIIETVHKSVPGDLKNASWSDRKMRGRVMDMLNALVPALGSELRWFNFGYEADGYLANHSRETRDFVDLYRAAAARIKQLAPGVQVSSTISFMNISALEGPLRDLNREMDYLPITYSPIAPGWTVNDPSVVPQDFETMKRIADGRKIVLQEVAYPTSPLNNGSEEKQARFFQMVFDEVRRDPGAFAGINFMMLADLSDADTNRFGEFYGMTGDRQFKAMMQTLGMFDTRGRPKKSWDVFRANVQR